jgi:Zn-dependent protease with chaperone function
MKRTLSRWLTISVSAAALAGCAVPIRTIPPDWGNPGQRLVGEELMPLLQAAGREPQACGVVFLETEHLNAVSLGNCTFGFTTGLAATNDRVLITGVAAHEVAHEALRHAEKAEVAATTVRVAEEIARDIGGWGAIASLGITLVSMVVMPAYSRSLEAAADAKALEILQAEGKADPAGTMVHTFEMLLAREGPIGGEILDTHPHTNARLKAMRAREAREPQQQAAAIPPREPATPELFRKIYVPEVLPPPDPRATWSERYKRIVATAEAQAKEPETREATPHDTKASE